MANKRDHQKAIQLGIRGALGQIKTPVLQLRLWPVVLDRYRSLNIRAMGCPGLNLGPRRVDRREIPTRCYPCVFFIFLVGLLATLSQSGCAGVTSVKGSANSTKPDQVAPSILTQPASQSVIAGQAATFSVSASGTAPISYQWRKNGTSIGGATAATYTTTATATSDSGSQFSVVVSNSTGTVTSNAATLIVNSALMSIIVSPNITTVTMGNTQQFLATVTGTSNTAVAWSVRGADCVGVACGTISPNGLYAPPASLPSAGTVTVKATSVADPTKSASATVVLVAAVAVLLGIAPTSASVPASDTQLFTATVAGTSTSAVSWSVSGAGCSGSSCGTISTSASSAVYLAPTVPPSPPSVTVKATSVADPTKSASANVTIVGAVVLSLGISPTSASVPASDTQLFTATVAGTSTSAVSWSVSGAGCSGSSCGTISTSASSAVYLAPTVPPSPPSVTVKATSVADPTKSASAELIIVPVQSSPPELSVTTSSDGVAHVYSTYTQVNSTQYVASDSVINATISNLGGGKWKVDITANRKLSAVYWPWQTNRTPLGASLTSDIYYYPYILGLTEQAPNHNVDWTWWGQPYPGDAFAPLTVMANNSNARLVAAINWPPKRVIPYYAAQRQVLYYDTPISAGSTVSFSALIAVVSGDAPHGNVPWQLAIDLYRTWLDANMVAVSQPTWMINAQGFLDIQLENIDPSPTVAAMNALWQPVKSYYPLVLFWGQMSAYAGGCCDLSYTFDPTHLPDIPNFAKSVVSSGYYAGYYSAPVYTGASGYLDTPAGISWIAKWINSNQSYGANSFYVDTLGRSYYGNPTNVMNALTNGTIPNNSIIEGAVDIYPAAGLVSGALLGDANGCGAPQRTPQNSVKSSYPQFGRYILRDRILFSGEANVDYRFWGTGNWTTQGDTLATSCGLPAWCTANGPCAYGTERLAFILGNKLDVMHPTNNPILDAINTARINSNWMQRQPVFLNTQGLDLSQIPSTSAVRITLFQDRGGKHLIAISNPRLESGLTFGFNHQTYSVPSEGLGISILDLP